MNINGAILFAALLFPAVAAMANPPDREVPTLPLADFGFVIGRIDYCGTGGQALFDSLARGLERFQLRPMEIQALLVKTQETREQARKEASQKFNDGPCPEDVRERIRQAREQIEDAWRTLVQNAAHIDLQPSVANALSEPVKAASSSSPASTPADSASPAGLCTKGRPVSIFHANQWYPAKVLDGPDKMGTCLVSYDGYESNWDEWVSASRMRPASNPPVAGTRQPQAPPAHVPHGKYNCYAFDSGQLNYSHTDVQILDGRRYAVGSKSGAYTLSQDGSMRFTGPLSNATGRFSMKSTGKTQIDLVFNGDARASMACAKTN